MLFEAKRAVFNPIAYPLLNVVAGATKTGVVLNFGVPNQMVETNNVLEVYVAKAAEASKSEASAVAKVVTLTVTGAPTTSGDITVAGVTITLDKDVQTTAALVATAIAAGTFTDAGWTAAAGTGPNAAKVVFTAAVAGAKGDGIAFVDTGETGATATVATTTEGADAGLKPDAPTLQIKVMTGDTEGALAVVQSSEVFRATDLVEGFVLYKAALPDKCGKLVRVDLVNGAGAGNDFADGIIVGVVRPI